MMSIIKYRGARFFGKANQTNIAKRVRNQSVPDPFR